MSSLSDHSDNKIRRLSIECILKVLLEVDEDIDAVAKVFFKSMRDFILNEIKA